MPQWSLPLLGTSLKYDLELICSSFMVALVEHAHVRVMDDRQLSDPQFVVGGPRIPSEVIRALEEERLVFFCGAGISIRTGLPNFCNLTLEAIKHIDSAPRDVPAHPALRDAFRLELYDKALDILEDIEGRRGYLRQFVATRLTRRLRNAQEQLRLHRALLDLARTPSLRPGRTRLSIGHDEL